MVKRPKSIVKDDGQVRGVLMRHKTLRSRKKPRGGRRGFFFDASNLGKLAGLTLATLKRSEPIKGADASVDEATGPSRGLFLKNAI